MNKLSLELYDLLLGKGASLCGFAGLERIVEGELQYGVSVAVRLPVPVLQSIAEGPSRIYFDAYHEINDQLDSLVTLGAEYLQSKGYRAHAKTRANVQEHPGYRTDLPHKTVATRAGLGWIGKSALLVTREFGPAVRISSLLTDAPLTLGEPINELVLRMNRSRGSELHKISRVGVGRPTAVAELEVELRDVVILLLLCRSERKTLPNRHLLRTNELECHSISFPLHLVFLKERGVWIGYDGSDWRMIR
jgi:hypothetical protein